MNVIVPYGSSGTSANGQKLGWREGGGYRVKMCASASRDHRIRNKSILGEEEGDDSCSIRRMVPRNPIGKNIN